MEKTTQSLAITDFIGYQLGPTRFPNLRMLNNMSAELLAKAAQDELTQMDEKLFLSTFYPEKASSKRKKG